MKLVHLTGHGAPPEVCKVIDAPDPVAGPGQAVVKIMACGINPADLLGFEGRYPGPEPLPAPCGIEGVGVVESVGDGRRSERRRSRHDAAPRQLGRKGLRGSGEYPADPEIAALARRGAAEDQPADRRDDAGGLC